MFVIAGLVAPGLLLVSRPTPVARARPPRLAKPTISKKSLLPEAQWRGVFESLDADADGALSYEEADRFIREISPKTDFDERRIVRMFRSYDIDGDRQARWTQSPKPPAPAHHARCAPPSLAAGLRGAGDDA